jgi:hypothetical protein
MSQSTKLADELTAKEVEHTYLTVTGAGHSMPPEVDYMVLEFFRRQFLAESEFVETVNRQ